MSSRLEQAQDLFIAGWGRMGPSWGISKMMGEIYGLLYLSPKPQTLEDMSDRLKTSRSNVSVNVRALLELGVVSKVIIRGERKDYYSAESDMAKVAKLLALAKKRKELDPAMEIVEKTLSVAQGGDSAETEDDRFCAERLGELKRHMDFVNAIFHAFVGSDGDAEGLAQVVKIKESHS